MKKLLILLIGILSITVVGAQITVSQTLNITVTGLPPSEQSRLNSSYQVSKDGTIRMWIIGSVRAAGRTPDQLAQAIASAYKSAGIYTSPSFSVIVPTDSQLAAKTYTVGGQVQRSGPQSWMTGTTLFGAIQGAGGPTPFGALTRVKLYRGGKVFHYNLKEDKTKGIRVLPGDMIEVPQKDWIGR